MSLDRTRTTMAHYLAAQPGDPCVLADDVVFTLMATGQQARGHTAILPIENQFYYVDFTAVLTVRVALFGEQHAMVEADFQGWRVGPLDGAIVKGDPVDVPLCIVYELAQERIRHGRVYVDVPALLNNANAVNLSL